jgi:hypothetical protein
MKRKRPFSQFETLAKNLVEGSFKRLFGEQLEPYEVAAQLARAMEDSQQDGWVATVYNVQLNQADLDTLLSRHALLSHILADYLTRLAQQAGFRLSGAVEVVLTADLTLFPHEMRVQAVLSDPVIEQTTQIQERPDVAAAALLALQALDAYLIIGGRRHVALDQPVLSLGRRRDNDVVLDSPTVSRQHAQIRWRYGRFVLYDLSRRGRTAVNNQPVSEHVLQSGDVIALSDTLIVYGENQDPRHRADTTLDEGEQTRQMPKV